ncbi:hypothetical protein ACO0RG_001763 [Hanseniaspora osmophila]|uniref:Ribosomal RNA-processing protein 43 n=1 Tax=Hanseniaspora osmophila TaxID=56408 RepID=A0A1E5RGD7_9ASCO|nr:Exosome complex component RRP43 [Hanseniaspora osmophila]
MTAKDATDIQPVTFPPEVLARIAPDISLQRHLSLGLRPSLRKYEEFREYHSTPLTNDCNENPTGAPILGGNISKIGNMFVITTITGGIVEELVPVSGELEDLSNSNQSTDSGYAPVWPQVEVERGRVGAPTDEEMIVSEKLYETILSSQVIPNASLEVDVGVGYQDGTISYTDETMKPKNRKWTYVLYAKQQVFSRSGPIFDLLWNSLMLALQNVKLPRVYIDERATDLKIPIRTRGRSASIRETYDLMFDSQTLVDLKIINDNVSFASNFGVIALDPSLEIKVDEEEDQDEDMDKTLDTALAAKKPVLLADLQDDTEEGAVLSKMSISATADGTYKSLYLASADTRIPLVHLQTALKLSVQRSKDLSQL